MQDSADKDAVIVRSKKDDVPPVFNPAVALPNPIAGAANLRGLNQPTKAGLHAVEIAISLLLAPGVHGVIGDSDQIDSSQFRKLIPWQLLHPARRQSTCPNTIADLAKNVPFGDPALFASQNGGAQRIELCLVFLFCLFKRTQACSEHFAGIRVVAPPDSDIYKFVHLGR